MEGGKSPRGESKASLLRERKVLMKRKEEKEKRRAGAPLRGESTPHMAQVILKLEGKKNFRGKIIVRGVHWSRGESQKS